MTERFSDKEGSAATNILRFLRARRTRMAYECVTRHGAVNKFSVSSCRLDPCFSKTEYARDMPYSNQTLHTVTKLGNG